MGWWDAYMLTVWRLILSVVLLAVLSLIFILTVLSPLFFHWNPDNHKSFKLRIMLV